MPRGVRRRASVRWHAPFAAMQMRDDEAAVTNESVARRYRVVPYPRRRHLKVVVAIERPLDGNPTPLPTILHRLDTKSCADIAADITAIRQRPVGISSLGMFDAGGWGIPVSPMTLMVTVGGVVHRPAFVDGELQERQLLPLTLGFDHAVVDGAPAARFAATLRGLFETAATLDDNGTVDHDSHSA